jgi:hypothetical protein
MIDNLSHRLREYENELDACSPEKSGPVFQRIADKYEDDLLELPGFPDAYFDFVLGLLSDKRFYSKPGVWNFLMVLSTEKHKLRSDHYQALAARIVDNYKQYADEELCLAACDFIARNYPFAFARQTLDRLATIEAEKPKKLWGFAKDGMRILAAEEKRAGKTTH